MSKPNIPTRRKLTAIHEAGHLVALRELFPEATGFWLRLDGESGDCHYGPYFNDHDTNAVAVHCAGLFAEYEALRRALGREPKPTESASGFEGSKDDYRRANEILDTEPKARTRRSRRCEQQLKEIIQLRWNDIIALADALLEKEELDEGEIFALIEPPPVPPKNLGMQICYVCKVRLPSWYPPGEHVCDACRSKQVRYRRLTDNP